MDRGLKKAKNSNCMLLGNDFIIIRFMFFFFLDFKKKRNRQV